MGRQYFQDYKGEDKVFTELKRGHHMELDDVKYTGGVNMFIGRFLTCHLAKNKEDCPYIYGDDATSLCNAIDHSKGLYCECNIACAFDVIWSDGHFLFRGQGSDILKLYHVAVWKADSDFQDIDEGK